MYQISIERKEYSKPVDMAAIEVACAEWMTEDQIDNHGERGEFIYVQFGCVGVAVDAINALGYKTDEDELDPSDRGATLDEIGFDVERFDK